MLSQPSPSNANDRLGVDLRTSLRGFTMSAHRRLTPLHLRPVPYVLARGRPTQRCAAVHTVRGHRQCCGTTVAASYARAICRSRLRRGRVSWPSCRADARAMLHPGCNGGPSYSRHATHHASSTAPGRPTTGTTCRPSLQPQVAATTQPRTHRQRYPPTAPLAPHLVELVHHRPPFLTQPPPGDQAGTTAPRTTLTDLSRVCPQGRAQRSP